jgi:hypothetical protein
MQVSAQEIEIQSGFKPFELTLQFTEPDEAKQFYTIFNCYQLDPARPAIDSEAIRAAMRPHLPSCFSTSGVSDEFRSLRALLK